MIKRTLFTLFILLSIFQKSFSENIDIYKKIDLFGEVLEKISKEYVDDVDPFKSMDSAINGLLQSLDPYSAYMSPESFKNMQTDTKGEFGGLGIEIGMEAGVVKIISPIDNTPASKAGLKAGDYIVKINNIQVQGKSLTEAVDLMRGPVGSSIEITVRRRSLKNMQTETSGEFGGLGIEVGMEAGVVKVISPIDNTPASEAGLKAGDYIVKINKIQVQGKSLAEAVDLMRGPVGSSIEITVRRRGVKKALTFNITRKIIEVQSVKLKLIDNNTVYIRLTSFNDNSSEQIEEKIKGLSKNKNIKGFILDLRNNPGGLLSQAIKISDFFLENGEIVSTKSRKISENRKWFAKKGDLIQGKTLIVLINYGSASASEIVAGALKDHKRAIIIGENSYGKGSVQSVIPLKNNGAIRLTIAKYYLPSGKSISEVGVTPDIEIEESSDGFVINADTDNQLNFALKLLNG